MSERAARAIGASAPGHFGVVPGAITLCETTITAAWNVQGNPLHAPFLATARQVFDVALPQVPNTTTQSAGWTALWLGPRSWLLVARGTSSNALSASAFTSHRDACNDVGGALFDVSASRVAYTIAGPHAASVLAKGCPLDFHPRVFGAGQCAQSLLGHINALIYRPEATPAFMVLVARSMASDAWHALGVSAAQVGYDVAQPTQFP